LWPRSAPVLTGCAALMVVELVIPARGQRPSKGVLRD
jgi:hypothetical protein